jgi:hypothetical protein
VPCRACALLWSCVCVCVRAYVSVCMCVCKVCTRVSCVCVFGGCVYLLMTGHYSHVCRDAHGGPSVRGRRVARSLPPPLTCARLARTPWQGNPIDNKQPDHVCRVRQDVRRKRESVLLFVPTSAATHIHRHAHPPPRTSTATHTLRHAHPPPHTPSATHIHHHARSPPQNACAAT